VGVRPADQLVIAEEWADMELAYNANNYVIRKDLYHLVQDASGGVVHLWGGKNAAPISVSEAPTEARVWNKKKTIERKKRRREGDPYD